MRHGACVLLAVLQQDHAARVCPPTEEEEALESEKHFRKWSRGTVYSVFGVVDGHLSDMLRSGTYTE